MRNAEIELLLNIIDQGFDRKSWHGTNLRGSLRGLTPAEAAWRPAPDRRNIWELILHAAYWKYSVQRRLTDTPRGSFPLRGSNFWVRPSTTPASDGELKADIALLVTMHVALRHAVAALKPADLPRTAPGGTTTILALVTGVAAHDIYHAGQIQLLKRLRAGTD
ncbi:MAG: DinB family protein [Blastocatellia bacterium]|jgi:hypothetical protein|nr:DinB family protein [Blastocatellia bacterium]